MKNVGKIKELSETKSDLILIIFFTFLAGTLFGAFGILCEEYLWDPNPKEGTFRLFTGLLLLAFGFLFIAITLSKTLKRRVDEENKKYE